MVCYVVHAVLVSYSGQVLGVVGKRQEVHCVLEISDIVLLQETTEDSGDVGGSLLEHCARRHLHHRRPLCRARPVG